MTQGDQDVPQILVIEHSDLSFWPSLTSEKTMSKLLRGLAAGYGAKKLGGGCISTILIFILLWLLLGNFDIFR
jgi:hypothetical protein